MLIDLDNKFLSYRETLFSQTSLELNRQMMNQKENEKLNKSIHSYLRLLSGHLLNVAARKTLEYLIRRYMYKTLPFTPLLNNCLYLIHWIEYTLLVWMTNDVVTNVATFSFYFLFLFFAFHRVKMDKDQ